MAEYNMRVEGALTDWARGKLSSQEVKKIMKQEGLMGDLREATQGVIELFPISGGSGEEYTFNSGGYVTKAYVNPVRSTDNRKKK
jgi:hypothetical protein